MRDVRYRLYADLVFIPPHERKPTPLSLPDYLKDKEEFDLLGKDENSGKYNAIFERRARKGQCFNMPYLGCREFSYHFRLTQKSDDLPAPIAETRDLGFMLYDLDFSDPRDPKPAFFRARLENGVVTVPDWDSKEVRR